MTVQASDQGPVAVQVPPASIIRRILGYIVEGIVWNIVFAIPAVLLVLGFSDRAGTWVAIIGLVVTVLCIVAVIINLVLLGKKGFTIGKLIVGLRVIHEDSAGPIGVGRAFLRVIILGLIGAIPLLIGYIVNLVIMNGDPRRQGWHDRIAHSTVVTAKNLAAKRAADADYAAAQIAAVEAPLSVPEVPSLATGSFAPPTPEPTPVQPHDPGPPPPPPSTPEPPVHDPGPPPPPPSAAPAQPLVPQAPVPPTADPDAAPPPLISAVPGLTPPVADQNASAEEPIDFLEPTAQRPQADEVDIDPATRAVARGSAQPSWTLHEEGEAPLTISARVLVGRAPDAGLREGASTLSIVDEARTLSKTHACFDAEADTLWVEDLHSTNGVIVIRGAVENTLLPGDRFAVAEGDVLLLGDRRFTVGRHT